MRPRPRRPAREAQESMSLDGLIEVVTKLVTAFWPASLALGLLLFVSANAGWLDPGLGAVLSGAQIAAAMHVFLLIGSAGLLVVIGKAAIRVISWICYELLTWLQYLRLEDAERMVLGIFAESGVFHAHFESGSYTFERLVDKGYLRFDRSYRDLKAASLSPLGRNIVARWRDHLRNFVSINEAEARALRERLEAACENFRI